MGLLKCAFAVLILTGIGSGMSEAAVLEFESLHQGAGYASSKMPSSYQGYQWTNAWYASGVHPAPVDGYDLTRDGLVCIYTPYGQQIGFSGSEFNLASMRIGAAWNDNQQALLQGYRNGVLTCSGVFAAPFGSNVPVTLNWDNVDQVLVTPYGAGTRHPGASGIGTHLVIDDVDVVSTPELSASALVLLGALPVGLLLRRRRAWQSA